jgi:hypothetical protein
LALDIVIHDGRILSGVEVSPENRTPDGRTIRVPQIWKFLKKPGSGEKCRTRAEKSAGRMKKSGGKAP